MIIYGRSNKIKKKVILPFLSVDHSKQKIAELFLALKDKLASQES